MPVPAVAAGVAAIASNKNVQEGFKKAVTIIGRNTNTAQDLFDTRDAIFTIFGHEPGTEKKWVQDALNKNRMNHGDVDNKKFGATYHQEFKRLWQFVYDALVNYRQGNTDLAEVWKQAVPLSSWNDNTHNYEPLVNIFNGSMLNLDIFQASHANTGISGTQFYGIGMGQAEVAPGSDKNVFVPTSQAGVGIFSDVVNAASAYVSNQVAKGAASVQTAIAGKVAGVQTKIGSGSYGVTKVASSEPGVTNQGATNGQTKSGNGMLWVFGILAFLFLGGFGLFKSRR